LAERGLDTADSRAWPVRVCKERMNALPLDGNQIYLWALRPDGVVLCLDHEAFSHPFEEETDPLKLYAVLQRGAAKHPELREMVPPPPLGVRPCEGCGGTGVADEAQACPRCDGLGWYAMSRPAGDWLNRIDRGDLLELRADSTRALHAGRLAGYYICADRDAYWSSPASPAAGQALLHRLVEWEAGATGTARWRENPTSSADPFDSLDHSLRFYGIGSGGSWEDEFARQPDGRYAVTETLNNDFDPAGPAFPRSSTREMDADAARVELERMMRAGGRPDPFPAIVPREPGA
jgi:hypothetical protein